MAGRKAETMWQALLPFARLDASLLVAKKPFYIRPVPVLVHADKTYILFEMGSCWRVGSVAMQVEVEVLHVGKRMPHCHDHDHDHQWPRTRSLHVREWMKLTLELKLKLNLESCLLVRPPLATVSAQSPGLAG
jgi:hypothetical protein